MEVGVWGRTGYSSMGPLCGLRPGQKASLTLNDNNRVLFDGVWGSDVLRILHFRK